MAGTIFPISVIIPTLNRHGTLIRTVQSLCSGVCVPKQIIVIDQSVIAVEAAEFGDLRGAAIDIEHPSVASSTIARNIGIKRSSEDILLFCDDDVLINEETIAKLYARISKPDIALVAAIQRRDNALYDGAKKGRLLKDICGTLLGMKKFWRTDGYVVKSNIRGRYATGISTVTNTEWAMGYFFCVKKQMLSLLGHCFDEHLIRYAYAEDLDITYRYCAEAGKQGLKTVVDPELYVDHLVSREWRVPKQEEVNYNFANRRYLSWKLFPSRHDYRAAMWLFDILYYLTQMGNREYAKEIGSALKLCVKKRKLIREGAIAKLS